MGFGGFLKNTLLSLVLFFLALVFFMAIVFSGGNAIVMAIDFFLALICLIAGVYVKFQARKHL